MNLQRKVYETKGQKLGDFILGIILVVVLNAILWGISLGLSFAIGAISDVTQNSLAQTLITSVAVLFQCLPWIINPLLIIYFALTRYWIALGMLAAIAIGFLLTLLLVAACFILVAGMSGGFGK